MKRFTKELQKKAKVLNQMPAFTITLLVASFYIIFTLVALGLYNWDPLWFVWMGEKHADLNPDGRMGYDGQFTYYIARYGSAAIAHLDNPAYRLQRILFPVVVRLMSLGSPILVPWVLLFVNFTAIVITTHLLTKWLNDQNLSSWYSLMYALYVGTLMAYSRDLIEPLTFCLAVWGVILWLRDKPALAVVLLALAAITKETSLIFVIGIFCSALVRRDFKLGLWVMAAVIPLMGWELYLFLKLDAIPFISGPGLEYVPLIGILAHLNLEPGRLSSLFIVGLPALVLLPVSLVFLLRERGHSPAAWWLLLHSVFVLLLPFNVYDHIMHAGRNAGGLILSVVFLLPFIEKRLRLLLLSYWVLPTLVWLIPVLRWAPWLSEI